MAHHQILPLCTCSTTIGRAVGKSIERGHEHRFRGALDSERSTGLGDDKWALDLALALRDPEGPPPTRQGAAVCKLIKYACRKSGRAMAQTGRTRSRRLTGLLLLLLLMMMTMTILMTVQHSNSLGLVQVVDCMSHKQPFAAKIWNTRNSAKAATGLARATQTETSTLTLPCEQSLRLKVLSDLSEIGIRFRHQLARREGIEPYTHVCSPTNLLAFSFTPKQRWGAERLPTR